MNKTVLVGAMALLAGCSSRNSGSNANNTDASTCSSALCDGVWPPLVTLRDGDSGEDDAADGGPDEKDAADDLEVSDGGPVLGEDASLEDGSIPNGLPQETIVGTWAISLATVKMCNLDWALNDPWVVVDGAYPDTYTDGKILVIDEEMNVVWMQGDADCTTQSCHAASDKSYVFVSFDGSTLIAEREEAARRMTFELVFSDENTFEGVLVGEGLSDETGVCGGADLNPIISAVRGVRTP